MLFEHEVVSHCAHTMLCCLGFICVAPIILYAGIAWARVVSVPRSVSMLQAQLQPAVLALLIAADESPIPGEFAGSCEIEYAARNPSYAEQPAELMRFQVQVEEGFDLFKSLHYQQNVTRSQLVVYLYHNEGKRFVLVWSDSVDAIVPEMLHCSVYVSQVTPLLASDRELVRDRLQHCSQDVPAPATPH